MKKKSILIIVLFIIILGCSSKKVSTNDNSTQDKDKSSNTILAQGLPPKDNDKKNLQIPKESPLNENDPKNNEIIFFDDFSNPDSGWDMWSTENTSGEFNKEEFVFKFYKYGTWSWALTPGRHLSNLSDYNVQFTASNPKKSPFLKFGICCNYKNDKNTYVLAIATNGYYNITKHKNGSVVFLTKQDWVYSDKIPKQAKSYVFSAVSTNGDISLYVNGNKIVNVHDETYPSGAIKLYGGYFGHETGELRFDNFEIKKIAGEHVENN